MRREIFIILLVLGVSFAEIHASQNFAKKGNQSKKFILTNEVKFYTPPPWLSESRIRKVTTRLQDKLEWYIRRVPVYWHSNNSSFQKAHNLGKNVVAVTLRKSQTIHLGPRVNSKNFDRIFAHELAHVVVLQKYKKAIPLWLEEGLANYVSGIDKVDYRLLARGRYRPVRSLTHPHRDPALTRYHYNASTALMKMIASKCPIPDLLQLSVGKKIETYLQTFCQIPDLDSAFQTWIRKKSNVTSP